MDELKRKLIANLQNYLRERMDFIASIPTMDPLWTAQFDIMDNLINPILDDIRDGNLNPLNKCPNLFLLFDGILRSEGIRGGGIAFVVKIFKNNSSSPDFTWSSEYKFDNNQIKYEINTQGNQSEFPIAIFLGTSGCQAFYGIIENILRNSGRHSKKTEIEKVVSYSKAIENKQTPNSSAQPLTITIEFYYDWNGEQKDDYIKVRIYDNMLGWQKENDKWTKYDKSITLDEIKTLLSPELKEFGEGDNKKVRDGRIIDDTGSTVQGNWGFKEMRICASFLRGIKIPDYERKYEPPVITPIPVGDNNEASLGFEFYIPKVKNLLIVSKNLDSKINKEELKNNGIYIEEDVNKIIDLQNRGVFTHEFVLIDIDDENNKKFIQENHLLLPYKLLFITNSENNFDFSIFKNIRYDLYLNGNLENEKENLKNLIISKNELNNWLTQNGTFEVNEVKYNCPPHERVYLEIYKRWIYYLTLMNSGLPKIGTYYNEAAQFWNYNLTFGSDRGDDENEFIEKSASSLLILHRFELFDEVKNYAPLCILPFSHGISTPTTKIKQNIQLYRVETNPNNLKNLLPNYFNGLEVGLTNVIIIDERIFYEAGQIKNVFVDINFALNWRLQNVVIFNLDKKDNTFQLKGYKVDPKGEINQRVEPSDVDLLQQDSENHISKYLPEHFKNKVHFLIIHQTIINPKLGGREEFKKFINSLPNEYKPWYVIITSGRGHPYIEEMPENTKFLDFSNLRNFVIDQPNKYLLTKVLTSLKEEKK